MPKALFLSLPLRGHVNPSLPLVHELVERHAEIVYYSDEPFAAEIEQAGARYRAYGGACLRNLERLPERTDELPALLTQMSAEVLETHLADFRAERVDYLVTDSVAPWGQWLGEILAVPVVTSVSTFAFNRRVLAAGVAQGVRPKSPRRMATKVRSMAAAFLVGRRLRAVYGVRGPGVARSVFGSSGLNIVYTSRYFQPCADSFDERFTFVGPLSAGRSEAAAFAWHRVRHPIVVYVSLGTLFNTDAAFYRTCFDAFAEQDCQVILATGTTVSPESLGTPPPNFLVEAHVPQLEVLRRASAFVTHGGMNSVSESLYNGVPVVVIPQTGEQAIVGRRVEALGAGLYLAKEQVSPERLRAAVRQLLTNDAFRAECAKVRESFQNAGGAAGAADAIASYTGTA